MFFLLDLEELLLSIVHHELLDAHVAAAHSDHQAPVDDLGRDLLGAEHVITLACPLHRDRTAQPIDVVSEKFIDNITHYGLVKLSGFGLLLETTAHLLILSLGVLNALRHVLKLSDEAYNAFLGLPIHLEQLEDSIGASPLQLK